MDALWRSRWLIGSMLLFLGVIGLLRLSYQQGLQARQPQSYSDTGIQPQLSEALSQCEAHWLKADQMSKHAQQQIAFEKDKALQLHNQVLLTQKANEALKDELAILKGIYNSKSGTKEELTVHPLAMKHLSGSTYKYHFILSKQNEKQPFKGSIKIQWVGNTPLWASPADMQSFLKSTQTERTLEFKQVHEIKGEVHLPPGFTPEEVIVLIASNQPRVPSSEHHFSWKTLLH